MTGATRAARALAAAALGLSAACGTTVSAPGAGAPPLAGASVQGDGLSVPDTGTPAGPSGIAPGLDAGGPGGVGGGTTGGGGSDAPVDRSGGSTPTTTGRAPTVSSGGGTATRPAVGPGITADKIHIGVAYFPDAASTNAALGAAGANGGDQRDYYNAVIEELNGRGGVLGRKVVPIYFEYSSTSGEPLDAQSQRACDRWTKDNKVFAILFRGRVLQECARKAGALITSGDGEAGPTYARLPNLVDPGAVRLERLAQATVLGLHRDRYFASTPEWPTGKVGIVSWDDASYQYGVKHGHAPALERLGKTALVRYISPPQNAAAVGDASAAVSNAVLAFGSEDVDHVLIQDGAAGIFGLGGLTLLFLNNAKSQNYFPRYGFNANNVPGFSIYPPDQQHGMLAVDFSDYMPSQDEGLAPNATRERCFDLLRKRSVAVKDQATYATAAEACDGVWFVETLLRRAKQPTLQGALDAASSLGTSFRSALTYGTRLGPGRRDGGELVRNARFDDGCGCMRYTSAPYAP